jgi:predicted AAA+ superfamily ATPase
MMTRKLTKIIKNKLNKGKVIVLLEARQVGKTTLLRTIFKNSKDFLWINRDEFAMHVYKNLLHFKRSHSNLLARFLTHS